MKFLSQVLLIVLFVSSTLAEPTPIRTPSLGPNGTKWPGQTSGLITPYMYDESVPNRIEVDPDWKQIIDKINALTDAQVSAGVLILVRPGILIGGGGSSQSPNMMNGIGKSTWTKRVTIAPRDGWGTVTISNGMRLNAIRNICFAGFILDGKLRVTSSTRFAFARMLINGNIAVAGDMKVESNPRQWEFVEFVKRKSFQGDPTDPMQLQNFEGLEKHLQGVVLDGIYLAPNFLPIGHKAHQDTIQHLGFSGWMFQNELIQDSVFFISGRAAINGGLKDTIIRNSWINAREKNQNFIYPKGGGNEVVEGGANQGSVSNITFDGGYVLGKLQSNQGADDRPYYKVMNGAKIDSLPRRDSYTYPEVGEWVLDTTDWPKSPNFPKFPTDEFLDEIWSEDTSNRARTPVLSPGSDTYDSAKIISISCPTVNNKIYYTVNGSTPTTSSTLYASPFSLSQNTTVKALCTATGVDNSYISTANYIFKVADPVITSSSLSLAGATQVSIAVSTAGAKIFYTLDGSTPTSSSLQYLTPISLTKTTEVSAIAIKAGVPNSDVIVSNVAAGLIVSKPSFTNLSLPQSQSGSFTVEWSATPSANNIDGVMGLSEDEVVGFTQVSAIVRFNPEGKIDVRDAGVYRALSALSYLAGKSYRFKLDVDLKAGTYSVFVTPEGGVAVEIAKNFKFRSESSTPESLDFIVLYSTKGAISISQISISGALEVLTPSAPRNLRKRPN